MEITLKYDVVVGDVVKFPAGTSFTIRRPKAKDMAVIGDDLRAMTPEQDDPTSFLRNASFAAMVNVAGALTGMGKDAAEEMDVADLMTIIAAVSNMLGEVMGGGAAAIGAAQSQT
jgi:hypothetical protein